jgi:altronate hydrolase
LNVLKEEPVTIRAIRVHPRDTVAVALEELAAGEVITVAGLTVECGEPIPRGHKIALTPHDAGAPAVKYGFPIGKASRAIRTGEWVHSHNLETGLSGKQEYVYRPSAPAAGAPDPPRRTFLGYHRKNGRTGTRNDIWIVNTVGCVNTSAEKIARIASERYSHTRVDSIVSFSHPYGCSQLGDDLANTQKILSGLIRHPNAGGVLVMGLGCENNRLPALLEAAGPVDPARIRSFNSQSVTDEIEEGVRLIGELLGAAGSDHREERPVSELVLGMKCGGSDGLSGITANPLVGRVTDMLVGAGGSVLLTEVPEMFGAEQLLMDRCADEETFRKLVGLINGFKEYFERHGQPVYENPSPGNKEGGITTLEEKSLGAIQKGGIARVSQVLAYGDPAGSSGLALINAPGNDGVSSTAMVAAGATALLFTTGRGTPLGFPVPTVKISTNSALAAQKPGWIDFDAGVLLSAAVTAEELASRLLSYVVDVATGSSLTRNESRGYREIAIWKEGVTL